MEAVLGNGCLALTTVSRNGRMGLLLQQTCEPHDIGSKVQDKQGAAKGGEEYIPALSDVIIWVDSLESARVLQDTVNRLCLEMNGFKVEDLE